MESLMFRVFLIKEICDDLDCCNDKLSYLDLCIYVNVS